MFSNLTSFGYKRSIKQAIGFYIAYFILVVITAGLAGGILGTVTRNNNSFDSGLSIGGVVGVALSMLICFLVVKNKKQLAKFSYILLILLSGILACFGGALLGLIPATYLTTRK